ncbi:tetratricopeptide repeat protein [Euryarchaeota archaeon]|nr:tetratricopeptide repeat protein [Euryarchaeota archaeon]
MSDFDIRQLLQDAEAQANSGNYSKSVKLYQKIAALDKNCTAAWYGLGVINAKLGNYDDSVNSFEQAHRINPDYGPTNANLAIILEQNDPERAANFAKMAMQTLGESDELIRISHLNTPKEIKLFENSHLYEENQDEEITLISSKVIEEELVVNVEENVVDSQEVFNEDVIEEVKKDFVNSKTARSSRAIKMSGMGDHASAVNEWKELLKKDSSDIDSWKGLANALSDAGYIERANQCLQRVQELIEIKKDNLIVDEEEEIENLVSAAKEVKEKINKKQIIDETNVNESIEWYNKGLILLTENNASESLNCFNKALSDAPSDEIELRVRIHNGKGHALYQLDEFAESIQEYHAAVVLDPGSVTGRTLYNMGSSYAAIELYSDAVKCFEQAKGRGLGSEDLKLCKAQINRCKLLIKEQKKFE